MVSFNIQLDISIVRLHTGGYSVVKKDEDTYDFQIVHHFIDLNELTLKKLPVSQHVTHHVYSAYNNFQTEISDKEEQRWFRRSSQSIEMEQPEEGKDWNTYFQYEAHKNLLKELPEDEEEQLYHASSYINDLITGCVKDFGVKSLWQHVRFLTMI